MLPGAAPVCRHYATFCVVSYVARGTLRVHEVQTCAPAFEYRLEPVKSCQSRQEIIR